MGEAAAPRCRGKVEKKPELGLLEQAFEPPPQLGMPELPTREAPISKITVPVTMGGKTRCKILGGTNDMEISKKEAISEVPSTLPYASGQGPREVVPSGAVIVGHVPSEYIASKMEFAVLRVAKLVPTTEMSPVPK